MKQKITMEEQESTQVEVVYGSCNDNEYALETSYLNEDEIKLTIDADTVCTTCSAEFLDASDLQTHIKEVHLRDEHSQRFCTFCLNIFPDTENFMLHIRNEHLLHLKWCEHCFRLFSTLENKMAHENKHKYRPKHSIFCSQCNQQFTDNFDIAQHEFDFHKNSEGVLINFGFSLLSSILNMNAKEFFRMPNNYFCCHCQVQHKSMHSYIEHLKRSSCKSYTCDKCCKVFNKKKILVYHIKKHNFRDRLKNSKKSQCLKCKQEFTFKGLRDHNKHCFLIKCMICSLEFDTMQDLTDHKTQVHENIVTLESCKLCKRQFVGIDKLKYHIKKTHQQDIHLYKYLCVYCCDCVFKHPKHLFGHFFSTHKNLLPYTCKVCNMKFRIRKKFTLHVRKEHKNVGFVEFDDKYNVYFVEKKSENPFIPQSIYFYDECFEDDADNSEVTNKKITKAKKHKITEIDLDSSDSDAPLLKIRKKIPKRQRKSKFICIICNKNCFTLQHFRHHMNLHAKRQPLHCIKCGQSFKSEKNLKKHIKENHAKSKLIETLHKIKERQKITAPTKTVKPINKFMKTLKKVEPVKSTPAELKIVKSDKKLSVRNFFENFKPSQNDNVKIHSSLTMKVTTENRKPNITLTKCKLAPLQFTSLKMPQKFVDTSGEPSGNVTIKFIIGEVRHAKLNYGERVYKKADVGTIETDHAYCEDPYSSNHDTQSDSGYVVEEKTMIPDVAEEIMLSTEELQPLQQKIVLPDMPEVMKKFRIGTLQAEAPYYKIIKLEDIVQTVEKPPEQKIVKLPNGVQLINVNPLAHLIKDSDIPTKQSKKYYKPKERDITEAIKKAMQIKPATSRRKKKVTKFKDNTTDDQK